MVTKVVTAVLHWVLKSWTMEYYGPAMWGLLFPPVLIGQAVVEYWREKRPRLSRKRLLLYVGATSLGLLAMAFIWSGAQAI